MASRLEQAMRRGGKQARKTKSLWAKETKRKGQERENMAEISFKNDEKLGQGRF